MTEATFPIASRKRQVGFYITVGLFSLLLIAFTGFMIPILPSVIIGWFNPDLFGIHQLHEMNGGGAITWLILAGMLLQLHHPERKVAALQMVNLVIFSTIVVSLVAGTFSFPSIIFLVFTVTAAYLHPKRQEMLRFGRPGLPELLALVALAAVSYDLVACPDFAHHFSGLVFSRRQTAFTSLADRSYCNAIGFTLRHAHCFPFRTRARDGYWQPQSASHKSQ
jgi:hypothetical protein